MFFCGNDFFLLPLHRKAINLKMEIIGKLLEKRDARKVSETFTIREFVIEVENQRNPNYNDFLLCQLSNDRVTYIDQYEVGSLVRVTFDLRGRKWTAPDGTVRYIMSLNAYRIDPPGMPSDMQPGGYAQQPMQGGYQQPMQGGYQQPMQGGFQQPMGGGYQQPAPAFQPQQPTAPTQQPQAPTNNTPDNADGLPF